MFESQDGLLIQAQRLSAVARAKKENENDAQAEGQVATAVTKINGQLAELEGAVRAYQRLRTAQVAIAPAPDLKGPVTVLKSQVAKIGRPSAQFLTKRSGDLAGNIAALKVATDAAWRAWAPGQIDALHGDEVAEQGPRVVKIKADIDDLRVKAKQKFSIADFNIFLLGLARVRDQIEDVQTPTDVEKLVVRIKEMGATLADLTDGEIVELRADPAIAGRISLGWV